MPARKIQDEAEVVRWWEEGKTYEWMAREYERKYHIQVSPTMFATFRSRKGLKRRNNLYGELIPWKVLPEHRYLFPIKMLRLEARRRAGGAIDLKNLGELDRFLVRLKQNDQVVHYDPSVGPTLVDREAGDLELIRPPEKATRKLWAIDE